MKDGKRFNLYNYNIYLNLLLQRTFRFKKCNSKSKSTHFSRISKVVDSKQLYEKGCWLLTHVVRPRWNLEGWLQVRVKTHEYALSTRLLNGGHVALKGHRIWAREVFFTKNQVNGARIHPIPSSSFPSPSPSTSFVLFVIYSLYLLSRFLIFFPSSLFYSRRIEEEEEVRQSWRVSSGSLSLLPSREADGVVSMNDA